MDVDTCDLVEAYPEGVMIPTPDGLLPLQLMINAGATSKDGIFELIRVHPVAVVHLNLPTGSFCSLLSRLDPDTMYRLLQDAPGMIQSYSQDARASFGTFDW